MLPTRRRAGRSTPLHDNGLADAAAIKNATNYKRRDPSEVAVVPPPAATSRLAALAVHFFGRGIRLGGQALGRTDAERLLHISFMLRGDGRARTMHRKERLRDEHDA